MSKKKKLTTKEIMDLIIDKDELENERKEKEKARKLNEKKIAELKKDKIEIIKEKKWWELPMKKSNFNKKSINNKFFAQYKGWDKKIWIGPYDSEKELDNVIKSYVEETKKEIGQRNIKNIKSILL